MWELAVSFPRYPNLKNLSLSTSGFLNGKGNNGDYTLVCMALLVAFQVKRFCTDLKSTLSVVRGRGLGDVINQSNQPM